MTMPDSTVTLASPTTRLAAAIKLKRLRVMNIHVGKMRPGQWRILTDSELAALKKALEKQ